MEDRLRQEAILTLEGRGAVLAVAREVSDVLREMNLNAAIIGGVAVVLHGHIRTTADVDVFAENAAQLAAALEERGFERDEPNRQWIRQGVPVHIVTRAQLGERTLRFCDEQDVRTVSLADLINLKLRTGTRDVLRAQDLADVIGLIRKRGLDGSFTAEIDPDLRPEFRKLVRAIEDEASS